MKKIFSFLLAFVMILSSLTLFVGCTPSSDNGNNPGGGNDDDNTSQVSGPLKIAVLSDIHLETEDEADIRKFKTAIKQCTEFAGKDLDAVLVVGDMLDSVWYGAMKYEDETISYNFYFGDEAGGENDYLGKELQMLVDVMDESIPSSAKFMYCLGNHDMISSTTGGGYKSISGNPYGVSVTGLQFDYAYYKDYFSRSERNWFDGDEPDHSYSGDEGTQLTQKNLDRLGARYFKLGNTHFISLSNKAYWTENSYNENQLNWLSGTLKYINANYPDDTVLLVTHQPLKNTTTGSSGGSASIGDILKKYPQVITFTGHDHNTIYNENALWQDGYTVVEAASVQNTGNNSYFGSNPSSFNVHYAVDSNAASQGLLVTVNTDSSVRIERMDFTAGTKVGADWEIPAVGSSNRATKYKTIIRKMNNVSPDFSTDAKPYAEVVDGYLNVRWGAASASDNDVWAYRVVATYNNGSSNKTLLVSPDRSVNDPDAEFYCSFANASTISSVTVTVEDSLFESSRSYVINSSDFGSASATTPVTASVTAGTTSSDFTLSGLSLGDYTIKPSLDYIKTDDGKFTNYKSTYAKGMLYFDGVYGKDYYYSFDMSKLRCNRSYTNSGYVDAKLAAGVCLATWGYNGKVFSLIAQMYFSDGFANGTQVPRPQIMKLTYYLVQQSNSSVGWATSTEIVRTVDITQAQREALSSDNGAKFAVNRVGTTFTIYLDNQVLDMHDFAGNYFYGNTFVPFTSDTTAAFGVATLGGEAYFSNASAVVNR